ncbi:HNH endonuclease [Microbacterium sp. dk485]|uniref:HNH endonuclease n=1 Tax=Microbacterium sp. dk485 TaxID=2560021 RepID=UPI00107457E3|nr:HNH endonuclease signature motif containing protein [Microbacterium sp. dk485]TFV81004.1 HNH endonuclease [Microbacterium sp. dk485]
MSTDATHSADDADAGLEALWEDNPELAGVLDPLDLVTETSTMMAVFAAQRFERVEAMHRTALTEVTTFRGASPEIIERSLRLELAAALQMTEHAADQLLITAEGLVTRYPSMLDSLHGARTTERHAEVFVELVDTVEPALRPQVIPLAVELAEARPLGAFRRLLRKLVETVRAATLEQRHRDAIAQRRVVIEPAADGMAWLLVHLPAVEAHAVHNRVTAMAKVLAAEEGETRTLDQLRADAVADLLVDGVVRQHPTAARGIRATVAVTVPAMALLSDELAGQSEPAVVEGVGPIPIEQARELCGTADSWMRILTHPETGTVLSVGRKKYRPPAPLRRLVRWRADRCMGPGCAMPAARCQIDHQVAWEDGGRTELSNLAPLCQGHHTVKHHGGWVVRQLAGGAIEWISPLGRRYVEQPERRVPVFRAA